MYKTIAEVPDDYRHMFYPPKVVHLNFDPATEFDFKAMNEQWKKRVEEMNIAFFMGMFTEETAPPVPEELQLLKRLKYAYINEGEKHYITYVDNETMKAYRMHDNSYYDGLVCPMEEVTDFTFDRWCRGMDL